MSLTDKIRKRFPISDVFTQTLREVQEQIAKAASYVAGNKTEAIQTLVMAQKGLL